MRVLVACEFSGIVRDAFRARGHDAWSCDILPTESDPKHHIIGDLRELLSPPRYVQNDHIWWWDLMIAHPPCTRLANSGVRWLYEKELWDELDEACEFYLMIRNTKYAKRKVIENPIMHKHARERLQLEKRQIVQPWWFGDPYFKAIGLELIGVPELKPTNKLTPPHKGTNEHKVWSMVHREPPGKDRWKNRSRFFPHTANAMADQWGSL